MFKNRCSGNTLIRKCLESYIVCHILLQEWEDNRLTWTPAAKDNIEEIFSKPDNIWKPELVVDNSYVV